MSGESPYASKPLSAIGEAADRPQDDPETGEPGPGRPLTRLPEPAEGSLEAALLGIRRASRDESGVPADW